MNSILHDILYFFQSYFLGASICALLIGAGYRFYYYKQGICRIGRMQILRGLYYSIFGSYLYIVLGITILSRELEVYRVIKLLPFSTFAWNPVSMKYVVENILLFVPFGMFVWTLWKENVSVKGFAKVSAVASIGIELLQFFTRRGRVETDDVMLNTLGAVIGWFLIKGFMGVVRFFLVSYSK